MKRASLFFLISALVAPLTAVAEDNVFVLVPAIISPTARIPAAVRDQCEVEKLLTENVLSAIGKRYASVQTVNTPQEAGAGTLLQLTILMVDGYGGGSFSGEKTMLIKAEQLRGGNVVATTAFTRSSRGGVFGPLKGTCSILDNTASALGKDVAKWMWGGQAN